MVLEVKTNEIFKEEQTTQWTKEKDNRSSTENYIETERLNLRIPHQPGMNPDTPER
jgi:hypothetical protein